MSKRKKTQSLCGKKGTIQKKLLKVIKWILLKAWFHVMIFDQLTLTSNFHLWALQQYHSDSRITIHIIKKKNTEENTDTLESKLVYACMCVKEWDQGRLLSGYISTEPALCMSGRASVAQKYINFHQNSDKTQLCHRVERFTRIQI